MSPKCNFVAPKEKLPGGAKSAFSLPSLKPWRVASISDLPALVPVVTLRPCRCLFYCFSESLGETAHFRGKSRLWNEMGQYPQILLMGKVGEEQGPWLQGAPGPPSQTFQAAVTFLNMVCSRRELLQ